MIKNFIRNYLGEILGCLTFILDSGMIMSTRLFIHDVTCMDMYNNTICDTLNVYHSEQILLQERVADLIGKYRLVNVVSLLLTGLFLGALTEVMGRQAGMCIGMFGYFINSLCLTTASVLHRSVTPVKYILIFIGVTIQGLFGERIVILKNALAYSLKEENKDHTQRQLVFQGVTFFGSFLACIGVSLPLEVNPKNKSYFAVYFWFSLTSLLGLLLPMLVSTNTDSQYNDSRKIDDDDSYKNDDVIRAENNKIAPNTWVRKKWAFVISLFRAVWIDTVSIVMILFKRRNFNDQTQILVLLFQVAYIGFVMQWYIEEIVLFTFLPPLNWRFFDSSVQYAIYALAASIYGVVMLPLLRKVTNLSDVSVYIIGKSAYTLSVTFMVIYSSETWAIMLYTPLLGMGMSCKAVLKSLIVHNVETEEVGKILLVENFTEHIFKLLGATVMFYIHSLTVGIYPSAAFVVNLILAIIGFSPIFWYIIDQRIWDGIKHSNVVNK